MAYDSALLLSETERLAAGYSFSEIAPQNPFAVPRALASYSVRTQSPRCDPRFP